MSHEILQNQIKKNLEKLVFLDPKEKIKIMERIGGLYGSTLLKIKNALSDYLVLQNKFFEGLLSIDPDASTLKLRIKKRNNQKKSDFLLRKSLSF